MRSLVASLLVLSSFVPGCADCSRKDEVPAPAAEQQQPIQQTPVTNHQYKKVMDLHPPVPKPFAPGGSNQVVDLDAGAPTDAK